MAQTGEVTPAEIRTTLNEVDTTEFAEATIEKAISDAEAIIQHELGDDEFADLDQSLYEVAVCDFAAYRTFMSKPAEMRRGALDLAVTYDAQTYANRLRDRRDESLGRIGVGLHGTSAGIADKTDGAFEGLDI